MVMVLMLDLGSEPTLMAAELFMTAAVICPHYRRHWNASTTKGRLLHGTSASVTANSETRNVQIVTDVNNANQGLGIYAFTARIMQTKVQIEGSAGGSLILGYGNPQVVLCRTNQFVFRF